MAFGSINRLRRWWHRRELAIWYDPAYRLPLAGFEAVGMEPRRADFAAWYLLDRQVVPPADVHPPAPISFAALARVHEESWLESLSTPQTLARIFAASPADVPVDALLHSVRLACGGTLAAAQWALARKRAALNLLGGFHHAGRSFGGGFCPVNDLAVAIATLRAEGFEGQVAILDLDAHPPDGTADCVRADPKVWLGSISASDWGAVEGADEVLVPPRTEDAGYLAVLESLLKRMPAAELAFVIAGGDVLAGDKFGALSLTLGGARRRDLLVYEALEGRASVWVPGGGYSPASWRVLAGTALVLAFRSLRPISTGYEPLSRRFAAIAAGLTKAELGVDPDFDTADLEAVLGLGRRSRRLLLDYYSAAGVEFGLYRYGILAHLARLGYGAIRIELDEADTGDRVRVFGHADGKEHLLIESVLERKLIAGEPMLYIHWLTLRHPRAQFEARRPPLPGQDVPGLGLSREASEVHLVIARRLGLAGIAFRPSWYHMAYAARSRFRFVDPARQGRFLAMIRDLQQPLVDVTLAVHEGRVRLNGEPYTWEADEMASWLEREVQNEPEIAAELERVKFTMVPPRAGSSAAPT